MPLVDLDHFRREGWVLVRDVAPEQNLRAAIEAICAFHAIQLDDPSTWFRIPADCWGVVPVHHAQAIWDNRSLPRIHAAFAEVLGSGKLWVSMDRCAFKVPLREHPER